MAEHAPTPDQDLSHTYVLHVWREHSGAPWRASLRASGSQQRLGFADLEQLAIFLIHMTEQRSLADSALAPDHPNPSLEDPEPSPIA
jgi:hypothetical protein